MTNVENANGGILRTDFKVTRFNKTTYTISGGIELTENMEHNYDVIFEYFYLKIDGDSFDIWV